MKKSLTAYLNFKSFIYILLCSISYSCNYTNNDTENRSDLKNIKDYFKNTHKVQLSTKISKLFVLTEEGCIPCNKKFSEIVSDELNNEKTIILIAASGMRVDISGFKNGKNVYFDNQINFSQNPAFINSKVIYFKENTIDTILNIEAKDFENIVELIRKRRT